MEIDLAHLAALAAGDPRALDPDSAITELAHLEGALSHLQALKFDLLVAAAAPEPRIDEYLVLDPRPDRDEERIIRITDAACEEIAAALRWSPTTTRRLVVAARLLAGSLPGTQDALASGSISERQALTLVDAAERLSLGRHCAADPRELVKACRKLEKRVLPVAKRGTAAQCKAAAHRALLAVDPAGARRRRSAAQLTRDVHVYDELDGISTLVARLSTEQAHAVMAVVVARATLIDDPALRVGERRADALASAVQEGLAGTHAAGGVQVQLDVVVDLDTLMGGGAFGTATLAGTSVCAEAARDLLADPEVTAFARRLVCDPVTRTLLDVGRGSYRIPERLREFIVRRDGTCRFPGCRRRAERCQIDHATPWDDGGGTDLANLGALCVRHHQLKTHGGWAIVESHDDGSCTWLSPQRRTHRHVPELRLPEQDADPPPF